MIIKLDNIQKKYGSHVVLDNFSHVFKDNTMTAIKGESGAGKSTLLQIIGLLDDSSDGTLYYDNNDVTQLSELKKKRLYRTTISFVFQNFLLLKNESILNNLKISTKFLKKSQQEKKEIYLNALSIVKLSDKSLKDKIYSLSGGEQQRVALARSIIKPSQLILLDEPTGSLDYNNGLIIMDILKMLQSQGKTIIMVTHNNDFDEYFDNILTLQKK